MSSTDSPEMDDLGGSLNTAEIQIHELLDLIVTVEGYIDELGQRTAALYRTRLPEQSEEVRGFAEALARDADRRAERARVRARMANADRTSARERDDALDEEWRAECRIRESAGGPA